MDEGGWRKVTEWQAALSFILWLQHSPAQWFIVQIDNIVLWFADVIGVYLIEGCELWKQNIDVMIPKLLFPRIILSFKLICCFYCAFPYLSSVFLENLGNLH